MKKLIASLLLFIPIVWLHAQESPESALPYAQIPDAPEDFTSGNVLSRMIDGLGFRYYWASEGLREEDLKYTISEEARSTLETLEHIYGLSNVILNGSKNQPNTGREKEELSYVELRARTLQNLEEASELLRGKAADEVAQLSVVFQRGKNKSEFPYWNMINGPLADAIYHTGQIVSFRRASGNSINPKISVFAGKVRE